MVLFGLVVLAGALVAAYFRRARAPELLVSSLFLWEELPLTDPPRRRARLEHLRSLLLVGLALGVLGYVLHQTWRPQRAVVVVDTSASMVETGRLKIGIDALQAHLATRPGLEVSLVDLSGQVWRGWSRNHDQLLEQIPSLDPALPDPTTLQKVVGALCGDHTQLVLLDEADPGLPCPTQRLDLGPVIDNVGIAELSSRPSGPDTEISLRLSPPVTREVILRTPLGEERLTVEAQLTIRRRLPTGATIEAELSQPDGFLPDDKASLMVQGAGVSVGLVTTRAEGVVERALRSHPRIELTLLTPDAADPSGSFDLLVVEAEAPSPPAHGRLLVLGTALPGWSEARPPMVVNQAIQWDASGVLQSLDLRELAIGSISVGPSSPDLSVVMTAGSVPIAWGGQDLLITGFHPEDTDWPKRTAFPLFIDNLVSDISPATASQAVSLLSVDGSAAIADYQRPPPKPRRIDPRWLVGLGMVLLVAEWLLFPAWAWVQLLRLLMVMGLGAVLFAPRWPRPAGATSVHVVDQSESVSVTSRNESIADIEGDFMVGFSDEAVVGPGGVGPDGVAAAEGLALALALIPMEATGTITFWSDGLDTQGLQEARGVAAARGIKLGTKLLEAANPAPLRWGELTTDLTPGASVSGTLRIDGGATGRAGTVEITLADQRLDTIEVQVEAGQREVAAWSGVVPHDLLPGPHDLEARLQDDVLVVPVIVAPPRRLLWVGGNPALTEQMQKGFDITRVSAPGAGLQDVDAVVLDNVPMGAHEDWLTELEAFVRGGGGLVVAGGDRAFDLGGYQHSALQKLLPVTSKDRVVDAPVTLVLALDKSGSMAESTTGGSLSDRFTARLGGAPPGSKIRLVSEAATAALRELQPGDTIGVLAVDTQAKWLFPPVSAGVPNLDARIGAIRAGGGGIHLFTALDVATSAMIKYKTPLKHLILFADTKDVSQFSRDGVTAEDFVARVHQDHRITVSVIGMGAPDDPDVEPLKDLARAGGGRFHLTQDASDLTTLFVQETKQLEADDGAGPLDLRSNDWHPAFDGLSLERPLTGFNRVEAKANTRVVLETVEGDPLLTTWRLGLGQVFAWTTDTGARWGTNLVQSDAFATMFRQMLTSGATVGTLSAGEAHVVEDEVVVYLRERPREVVGVLGDEGTIPFVEDELGVWRGSLAEFPPGILLGIDVVVDGEPFVHVDGVTPRVVEDEATLLAALEQPVLMERHAQQEWWLWPWILLSCLVLLPIDAALRRGVRAQVT